MAQARFTLPELWILGFLPDSLLARYASWRLGRPLRIIILGGTFNPFHRSHQDLAQYAYEQVNGDIVLFITTGNPSHKVGVLDKVLRHGMVKAAVRWMPHFRPSRIELDRPGHSHTYITVQQLQHIYGQDTHLFLVLGIDQFCQIENWPRYEVIFALCTILVTGRADDPVNDAMLQELIPPKAQAKQAVQALRCQLSPISATEIRKLRSTLPRCVADERLRHLVPAAVLRYIKRHNLYLTPDTQRVVPEQTEETLRTGDEYSRTVQKSCYSVCLTTLATTTVQTTAEEQQKESPP